MKRFSRILKPLISHRYARPLALDYQRSNSDSDKQNKFKSLGLLGLILGGGVAFCEDKPKEKQDLGYDFFDIKIPSILREKQADRNREYQRVKEQAMEELDKLDDSTFREQIREYTKGVTDQEQAEGFAAMVEDAKMLSQQSTRQVYLGAHQSLLEPGKLIQLSIAKFNSPDQYDPLDKVIVMRNGDVYNALSSYCGYDMTDLANGVALGNKLICPTCGSQYRIYDGAINFGPTFQALVSFPVVNRKGHLFLLIPKEGIPPFARKETPDLKKLQKLDTRTYVIVGSNQSIFGVIEALRKVYLGKIVLVPLKKSGLLENKSILSRRMEPLEKEDVMLVDQNYFQRMNVVLKTEPNLLGVDLKDKYLHFEGDQFLVGFSLDQDFDKIIYAIDCEERQFPKNIKSPRIIPLTSFENHARIHNEAVIADDIVIYGATIQSFQLASSLRRYLDSLNRQHVKITIIDDRLSEVLKNFGPQIYIKIIDLLGSQNINVLSGITLKGVVQREDKLKIHFKYSPLSKVQNKLYDSSDSAVYSCFLKADLIIKKTEPGQPLVNFHSLSYDKEGELESELDHSLRANTNYQASQLIDHDHFIFAVGPSVSMPSLFQSDKMRRSSHIAYNLQQGYVAGLNMADKKFHLDFPPLQHFQIASQHFFFLGERGQSFTNVIRDKTMEGDNKFVAYFVNHGRVIGALVMGYKNLHVYISQAIQIGQFPQQRDLVSMNFSTKEIVKKVMMNQDKIRCTSEKELQNKISQRFYEKPEEIQEYQEQRERDKMALENEKQRRIQIIEEQRKKEEENKKRKDGQVEVIKYDNQVAKEQTEIARESILNSYIRGLMGKSKKA